MTHRKARSDDLPRSGSEGKDRQEGLLLANTRGRGFGGYPEACRGNSAG